MKYAFRLLFVLAILLTSLGLEFTLKVPINPQTERLSLLFAISALFLSDDRDNRLFWALGLIAMGSLISAAFTAYRGFDWPTYFGGFLTLMTPFVFCTIVPTRAHRDFVLFGIAMLPVVMLLLGVLYTIKGIHPLFAAGRLEGSTIPAYLGAAACSGTIAALYLGEIRDRRFAALAGLNFVLLLLSGARMPVVATLIAGLPFAIFRFRQAGRAKLEIAVYGLLAAIAVGSVIAGNLLKRLNAGTSGRDVIWQYVESVWTRYPYFGIGLGGIFKSTPHSVIVRTNTGATHNDYLRILAECGEIGAGIILIGILVFICLTWSSRRINYSVTYLAGAAAYLVFGTSDNALARPEIYFLLVASTFGSTMGYAKITRSPKTSAL